MQFEGQNLLVPRVSRDICEPEYDREISANTQSKSDVSVSRRLESLLLGPKSLLRKIYKGDSISFMERYSDRVSSMNSVQLADDNMWTMCDNQTCSDESVEIPEGFKVREFPASSLLLMQNKNKPAATKTRSHMHTNGSVLPLDMVSGQNERFYHVFKQGEIAELVNKRVKGLSVKSCTYDAGNWYTTLVKADGPTPL